MKALLVYLLLLVTMTALSVKKLSEGRPCIFQSLTVDEVARNEARVKSAEHGISSSRTCQTIIKQSLMMLLSSLWQAMFSQLVDHDSSRERAQHKRGKLQQPGNPPPNSPCPLLVSSVQKHK